MNKYQKALIIVKEQLRNYYDILDLKFPLKVLESIKLLQKSVDKQKPQKVKYVGHTIDCDFGFGTYKTDKAVKCPRCNHIFIYEYEAKTFDYCPFCGQKLNWGTANGIENNIVINDINEFNKM